MNLEQYVKDWLFNCGLWEDECAAIFEIVKETSKDSNIRWNDFVDGYPEVFKQAISGVARKAAIDYLEANKPQHFALFMLKG